MQPGGPLDRRIGYVVSGVNSKQWAADRAQAVGDSKQGAISYVVEPNVIGLEVPVDSHERGVRRLVQVLERAGEGERMVENLGIALEAELGALHISLSARGYWPD